MKKIIITLSALLLISISQAAISQNNGVSITSTGVAPDASAMLDVVSSSKGVLIPRMSIAERNAIASPANGLQVYNTDCNSLNYYNGTCWLGMGTSIPAPYPITSNTSTSLCANSTATYSVPAVTGATSYNWTVPAGAIITSGFGTTSIDVTYGNVSGQICVAASNACETSPNTCISVNISPVLLAAAGPDLQYYSNACSPVTIGGSPTASGGAGYYSYSWSPATGLSGSTLANPTANPSATTSYIVTVGSGGCSATSSMTFTVASGGSQVFNYTGTPQTWIVPAGVSCINITAKGASGGAGFNSNSGNGIAGAGGLGGTVSGIKLVTPGTVLTINVGQQGGDATSSAGGVGGINGGGNGGYYFPSYVCSGGGGGGASDVMLGGASPANRIIVGAGGGGGGEWYTNSTGGYGGYPFGGNGFHYGSYYGSTCGVGGTLFSGGIGGSSGPGIAGGLGFGGNAYGSGSSGGGGGGFYGGGGGGSSSTSDSGGGGGGSSYIGGMSSNTSFINGNNSGNGQVTISW